MKFAIVMGINDYSWLGSAASLRGCVNDAKEWAELLVDYYRFDEVDLLLNGAATPAAFRQALSRLAERAVPGDRVVVTYSGHGTRVPDKDGDEPDGYDEAICLSGAIYTDDELYGDLKMFPADVPVTIIADSCHSGTLQRGVVTYGGRTLIPKFAEVVKEPEDGMVPPLTLHHRFGAPRGLERPNDVLLAGCKAHETSMDAYLAKEFHGALSFHAVRLLQEDPAMTWREMESRLRPRVACCSPQTPQIEGTDAALAGRVFL